MAIDAANNNQNRTCLQNCRSCLRTYTPAFICAGMAMTMRRAIKLLLSIGKIETVVSNEKVAATGLLLVGGIFGSLASVFGSEVGFKIFDGSQHLPPVIARRIGALSGGSIAVIIFLGATSPSWYTLLVEGAITTFAVSLAILRRESLENQEANEVIANFRRAQNVIEVGEIPLTVQNFELNVPLEVRIEQLRVINLHPHNI